MFRASIALIWISVAVFILVLYAVLRVFVLRSFAELENREATENDKRAVSAIAVRTAAVNAKASDWSAWDDAYEFMENRNPRFIRSNFVLSAFTGIGLNLIVYISNSGQIVYGRWYQPGTRRLTPVPDNMRRAIFRGGVLTTHQDVYGSISGIVMLDQGPMLVASRPVITSNEAGPIRGSLIFGRLLDADELQAISRLTREPVTIERLDRGRLPADFARARARISRPGQAIVEPIGRRSVAGYTILDDIYGRPALILRVETPRTLYNRGVSVSNVALASLVILSILFGSIVTLLLVRTVHREQEFDLMTREFYRRTIYAATEGKLIITERDETCEIAGEPVAAWDLTGPEDVSPARHGIMQMAREFGMAEDRVDVLVTVAGEALTNAVKHAGGGRATLHRIEDGLMLVVADHGPGIPALTLPDVALRKAYSTVGTLGMGYSLMMTLADRVYLATGPQGTTVGLVMGFQPPEKPPAGMLPLEF